MKKTKKKKTAETPPLRRHRLVILCAILVAIPVIVVLGSCVYLTAVSCLGQSQGIPGGFAIIGIVLCPAPLLLLLLFEYQAIFGRMATASLLLAVLFAFPVIPGLLLLVRWGATQAGFEVNNSIDHGGQAALIAAIVAYTSLLTYGHFRWWKALNLANAETKTDTQ